MTKTLVVLTPEDGKILLQLIEKEKKTARNQIETEQERPSGAPEIYVVRVPEGGIPPLTRASSGTSSLESNYDVPGTAMCQVYKTYHNQDIGEKELRPVSGFLQLVLNISQSWVDSLYAIATREKYGCFVVECPCVDVTGTGTTGTGSSGTGTTGTGTTGTGTTGTGTEPTGTGTQPTGTGTQDTGTGTSQTGTGTAGTGSPGTCLCIWTWNGSAWNITTDTCTDPGCNSPGCDANALPPDDGTFVGETFPGACRPPGGFP